MLYTKTWISIVVSLVILCSVSLAHTADYRNVNWGMSKSEVKQNETQLTLIPDDEDSNDLYYRGEIAGHNIRLHYNFTNNVLSDVYVSFQIKHTNFDLFIDDYKSLKDQLTQKYGNPVYDKQLGKKNRYRSIIGMDVATGRIRFMTNWNIPKARIFLNLRGDNYKVNLSISYLSNKFYVYKTKNLKDL